jgi:hypothetical protein
VASGNESEKASEAADQAEKGRPTLVAEWTGTPESPRVDGVSIREVSKKDVKDHLVMTIPRDMRWGPETNYRMDVSDFPDNFIDWMKKEGEWKVSEE